MSQPKMYPPSQEMLSSFKYLPTEFREAFLDDYYLLFWDSIYFITQVSTAGFLKREGKIYKVVYSPGHSLEGMIHDAHDGVSYQVALSFRKAKPTSGLYSTVVVFRKP